MSWSQKWFIFRGNRIVWTTPRSSERFMCDGCRWRGSDKVQFWILIMYWIRAVTFNDVDKWLTSCSGIKYLPAISDPLFQNVPVMQFLSIKRGCIVEFRGSQLFLGCDLISCSEYVCDPDVNFCESASTQIVFTQSTSSGDINVPVNVITRSTTQSISSH